MIVSLLSSLMFFYAVFFYMNNELGIFILPNIGKSMEPTLTQGDLVVFKSMDAKDLQEKKIVCLDFNEEKFIIHRIKKILDKDKFLVITKGDNNKDDDEPRLSSLAKWSYVFHVPFLGYLFLKKFLGIQLVFYVLAGNLITNLLILFKYKK
ncbi:MAG: signal peptidase I [Patescibacteria group bacterium]